MTISPEEQANLDAMKIEVAKVKTDTWNFMREIIRMDETQLRHSGYKTVGDALIRQMETSQTKIKKLEAAFLRKWPD